ncbi:hypothetical protein [Burkholderia cenocepacia]|uniref:hypothetical protein n=1 Tax=Burkholderia cenocepacia TaxID=95486 RepID=UPI000761CAAF|nr:hypothetical protein [Burkholderia cenocepacia]KWU19125.1 hypothetical protein AS149_12825 [Burkholderia cenocepacia]
MDHMSADLLISQLAALHGTYAHEQKLATEYGNAGPLDGAAVPVPTELLEAAVAAREDRTSRQLDAVRALLRILWQGYDAGGHSVGRSFEARVVETAMMLVGPPSSHIPDVSTNAVEIVRQCEARAYALSQIERDSSEWASASERFRASYDHRQSLLESDSSQSTPSV